MKEKTPANDYLYFAELAIEIVPDSIGKDEVTIVFTASQEGSSLLDNYPWFKGEPGESVQTPRRWHYGLGKLAELDETKAGEILFSALSDAASRLAAANLQLPSAFYSRFSPEKTANMIAMAAAGASTPVDRMKSKPSSQKIILKKIGVVVPKTYETRFGEALTKYKIQARYTNGMRSLQVLPSNVVYSDTIIERAKEIAQINQLKITIFGKAELEAMGAGGILAVNRGSRREPAMAILEYSPKGAQKTLAMAGKGVTFDTGGISIKPSEKMHDMKYDMSGAAAVLHAIGAAAAMGVNTRIIAAIGLVENKPDGSAQNPGDVYRSLKGHTVEVQNTDAEGRLVLADLLTYLEKEYNPDLIVDMATLTGACVIALAYHYAGLFTPSDETAKTIEKAAKDSLEPVWRLPVDRIYREMLKSEIADFNNIGGRYGGASSAAAFLSAFLDHPEKWAHIDIAGTGMIDKNIGVYQANASGYGVRLLTRIAELMAGEK